MPTGKHGLRLARAKLRQAMPEKETLDVLMKNQHKRLIDEVSAANGFMIIPRVLGEDERARIRESFSCYDVDNSGALDTAELRGALADLGYCPQSREEKLQFSKILEEVDREGDGELDMEEFEQAVVKVMEMLRNLQSVELHESFQLHDVDGTGSLSIDEIFDILPELGLAPRIDQEHDMIRQCVANQDVDKSSEIDFNEFEELLVEVRKRLHRMRRERRRSIIHHCELDREIVEAFKNEICELKDQFDCYDQDRSGFLDRKELNLLIADCGLGPRSKAEREEIQALIAASDTDSNAQVTFMEFLHLIHGIRRLSSARCYRNLQKLFLKFDKDGSGSMSLAECSRLLEQFGLSPKTQQEQRHIGVLLEAIDEDGNGELDFEEFSHLCQRVKEMLQLKIHHKELNAAKSLQITIAQLQEYRAVFEHVDADETGQLSIERVREMVDSLHIHISGDELHEIFTKIDEDASGFIEFTEFLKLISAVQKHAARSDMRFRT
jgi:calcium-binding protein CML